MSDTRVTEICKISSNKTQDFWLSQNEPQRLVFCTHIHFDGFVHFTKEKKCLQSPVVLINLNRMCVFLPTYDYSDCCLSDQEFTTPNWKTLEFGMYFLIRWNSMFQLKRVYFSVAFDFCAVQILFCQEASHHRHLAECSLLSTFWIFFSNRNIFVFN